MRKYLTIVLVSFMLLIITSCKPIGKSGDYPKFFTGVANGVAMEDMISVTVSDRYKDAYGSIINVNMKGLKDMELQRGDMLYITLESVEDTYPLTINASKVILKYREHESKSGSEYYGHGPYTIPDVSDLCVPDDFPDLSDKTTLTKNNLNWSYYVLRIVSIQKDRVYLAKGNGNKAMYVLYGSLSDDSLEKGDFLKIDVKCHYIHKDTIYEAAYAEDVTKTERLTLAEAEEIIRGMYCILKPVIYLYPIEETNIKVNLRLNGNLTCTYPQYKNGWNVKALPNSIIYDEEGNEYYCLYWEAQLSTEFDLSKGFCVSGKDTAVFLREKLLSMGLTPREVNEFIIYWLPVMQENKYNVISFQTDRYEEAAELLIEPKPDSILRVYMTFYASDRFIEIEPQIFKPFNRNGFAVVEWGGSQFK